jgi:predicted DNA-binding transcriptional regulator AlpA
MNATTEDTRLVKKKELAHLLAVSPRTIDNWVSKRVIPYIAITPRLHLFDPGAVRRVIAERFGVVAR